MAKDYALVLQGLDQKFEVVGRGADSSNSSRGVVSNILDFIAQ